MNKQYDLMRVSYTNGILHNYIDFYGILIRKTSVSHNEWKATDDMAADIICLAKKEYRYTSDDPIFSYFVRRYEKTEVVDAVKEYSRLPDIIRVRLIKATIGSEWDAINVRTEKLGDTSWDPKKFSSPREFIF